jgi:hypothetical protein
MRILITFFLLVVPCFLLINGQSSDQALVKTLLANYSVITRPGDTTQGEIIFFLNQVVGLDFGNQVMTSSIDIYFVWGDGR